MQSSEMGQSYYDIVRFSKGTTKSLASRTGSYESNELAESKIASEL